MKKRISKREREQAALFASVIACNPGIGRTSTIDICEALGIQPASTDLWFQAWCFATSGRPSTYLEPVWDAEAEALLRTGWSP